MHINIHTHTHIMLCTHDIPVSGTMVHVADQLLKHAQEFVKKTFPQHNTQYISGLIATGYKG